MTVDLSHRDIEELLGAYALDALEPDEAVEVSDHLLECPRCRAEVAEHREVAALLAHSGGDAPAELWERIAAAIDGTGPSDQDVALIGSHDLFSRPRERAPESPSWRRRALVPLAAAAAAVIAVLAFQVVVQGDKIDRQGEQLAQMSEEDLLNRAFQASMADPTSEVVTLRSPDRELEVQTVVNPEGSFLSGASLPALPADKTYQLWGDFGDQRVSLGVLGQRPKVTPFDVDPEVEALMVTAEDSPGVAISEQSPVAFAAMADDA